MKKIYIGLILSIIFTTGILFINLKNVWADTSAYELYKIEDNGIRTLVGAYTTYQEANTTMQTNEQENPCSNGYLIIKDGEIRNITYGLVNFKTKTKGENTTYTIESNGRNGYTNGHYGPDGAFLGTNEDGTKIRFKQSGVIGWVNASEVKIIDMIANYPTIYTSSYIAYASNSGSNPSELIHNIVTDLYSSAMSSITLSHEIPVGMAGSIDKKRTYYLSYDGNYFYEESLEGYKKMIHDYKLGTHTNAINKDNPYYNYYQYITHRTISNYTAENIEQYYSKYTAKPTNYPPAQNESMLHGEGINFVQYQNEYGTNAILMFTVATNESGYGRSQIAITTNNLFGHGAFDASPGASATRYYSVAQSIRAHSKIYISEGFLDPCDGVAVYGDGTNPSCHNGRYFGGNVGNKASGMNVKYASDPYWGEKAAQYYYYFDKNYGYQDFGKYRIGIKETNESYPIKAEANSTSKTLYTTGSSTNYSVIVLENVTGEEINGNNIWYKIQTDPTLNRDRTGIVQDQGEYNFNHNYGYIHSSAISFVRTGKENKPIYTIKFDPNGGSFADNTAVTKTLYIEEYVVPAIIAPTKTGYTFTGWDKEVSGATENVTYKAVYKKIEEEKAKYKITFDGNGGTFKEGTTTKSVLTEEGSLPTIGIPERYGYTFIGWDKEITNATEDITYKAQWEEKKQDNPVVKPEPDVELKQADGEFYLNELTWNNDKKKYNISGYFIILNEENNQDNISYELILKDKNNTKEYTFSVDAWLTNVPYDLGTENGKNYSNSWFKGDIDMSNIPAGDYNLYMKAIKGNFVAEEIVSNMFNKKIDKRAEINGKGFSFKVQLSLKSKRIELYVRNNGNITNSTASTFRNMVNDYDNMQFINNQLNIIGTSYNYGGTYDSSLNITRNLILENTQTFEQYTYNIGSTNIGSYKVVSTDNKNKDYAWYNASIDIAELPVGSYSMIVHTKTIDSEDYGEIIDIFSAINKAETTINGKKYRISLNKERLNRIELIVE